MDNQKKLTKKSTGKNLLKIFLLMVLSIYASSCKDDDFYSWRNRGKGNGNSNGNQRDSTFRDSTRKDSTYRDSTAKDSTFNNDTCGYRKESYFDDIGIRNNMTFSSTDRVFLNYRAVGINQCAKNTYISEERKVSGNTVNIKLKVYVDYFGCICSQSLMYLNDSYQIKRENSNSPLTYIVSYTDVTGNSNAVSFSY